MAYATSDDVADRLGRTLTATEQTQVTAFLDDATGFIDGYLRRSLDEATVSQILPLVDNRVRLPKRPVSAVASVKAIQEDGTVGATLTGWRWDGIATVDLIEGRQQLNLPEWWNDEHDRTVQVTYTHGYATVPDDVKAVCAQLATRAFLNPTGLRSETVGDYSYSLAIPATGVPFGAYLDPNSMKVLDRYRTTARTVELR